MLISVFTFIVKKREIPKYFVCFINIIKKTKVSDPVGHRGKRVFDINTRTRLSEENFVEFQTIFQQINSTPVSCLSIFN